MKKILLVCLLSVGLISCNSCSKSTKPVDAGASVDAASEASAPQSTVLSKDNWSLSVPSDWETQEMDDPTVQAALFNKDKGSLILLIKEPFKGSLEEYTLTAVRGIKNSNAELTSLKEVDVNNNSFVLLESSKSHIKLWMWLSVKNNCGYALSCGGVDLPELKIDQSEVCNNVISSLKLR